MAHRQQRAEGMGLAQQEKEEERPNWVREAEIQQRMLVWQRVVEEPVVHLQLRKSPRCPNHLARSCCWGPLLARNFARYACLKLPLVPGRLGLGVAQTVPFCHLLKGRAASFIGFLRACGQGVM